MARKFCDSNGNVRKSRNYAGFRGTKRYASLTTHYKHEQVFLQIINIFTHYKGPGRRSLEFNVFDY